MTPKFDKEDILQERKTYKLKYRLDTVILEFALLGYVDIARKLAGLQNEHNSDSKSNVTKPLQLLWAEIGNWPDGESENAQESVKNLAESYAKELSLPDDQDSESSDEEKIRRILKRIDGMNQDFADATTGSAAMDKSKALVQILDNLLLLAEENTEEGDDPLPRKKRKIQTRQGDQKEEYEIPSVEETLERISERLHCNQQIAYLAQSARAWKILKNKALAKAVGVQDAKIVKLGEEVEETFNERFKFGPKRSENLPMSKLIEICAENSRSGEGAKNHWAEMGEDPPEKFTHSPASSEDISELEKRLDITLSDDFKEFLKITNGLDSTWGGILMDSPLFSIKDIRWIGEDEDYFTDLDLDLLDGEIWSFAKDVPEITDNWPKVGRTIEIGTEEIDNVWLLPPHTVDTVRKAYLRVVDNEIASEATKKKVRDSISSFAGSREEFEELDWCLLTWAAGGSASMVGYPSFKAYMASKARESGMDRFPARDKNHERECFAYSCR